MHDLCVSCTFSTFTQKIFEWCGWNFTWSICEIMSSKSMEIVFVANIIRHRLCMIYAFFYYFVQKSFSTKNYFFIAAIDFTTQGPYYTCLVYFKISSILKSTNIQHLSYTTKILNGRVAMGECSIKLWHGFVMS